MKTKNSNDSTLVKPLKTSALFLCLLICWFACGNANLHETLGIVICIIALSVCTSVIVLLTINSRAKPKIKVKMCDSFGATAKLVIGIASILLAIFVVILASYHGKKISISEGVSTLESLQLLIAGTLAIITRNDTFMMSDALLILLYCTLMRSVGSEREMTFVYAGVSFFYLFASIMGSVHYRESLKGMFFRSKTPAIFKITRNDCDDMEFTEFFYSNKERIMAVSIEYPLPLVVKYRSDEDPWFISHIMSDGTKVYLHNPKNIRTINFARCSKLYRKRSNAEKKAYVEKIRDFLDNQSDFTRCRYFIIEHFEGYERKLLESEPKLNSYS